MTQRRTRAAALAITALLTGVLGGCAGAAPDLSTAAATRLQADVLAVSQASAAGDLATARAALATLESHVEAARGAGDLSPSRQERIDASVALISADLATLDEQAVAAAAATAAATAVAQAAADTAAANKAAADAAAQPPAVGTGGPGPAPAAPGKGPDKDKRK